MDLGLLLHGRDRDRRLVPWNMCHSPYLGAHRERSQGQGGGWGRGSALLSLPPTSPWLGYPNTGADTVPEKPSSQEEEPGGRARRRGGEPPPPRRVWLYFPAEVKVLLTPKEKIYFFNNYSSKEAAGQWAFPQLGTPHLPHSKE